MKYTDLEIDLLRQFWQNTDMREAVWKVLSQDFSVPPDDKLTDEHIGQKLRAIWAAKGIIQGAFKEIEDFNFKVEPIKDKSNQAR